MAIVRAADMSATEKAKLIELANKNDQQFYDFLRIMVFALFIPVGSIFYAAAEWIRKR